MQLSPANDQLNLQDGIQTLRALTTAMAVTIAMVDRIAIQGTPTGDYTSRAAESQLAQCQGETH